MSEGSCAAILHMAISPQLPQIRGSTVQQDGRSSSITAPNGSAQARMLAAVYRFACLNTSQLSLLEAHGTGTPLGDPVEVGAVVKVAIPQGKAGPLALNCVKANVAHSTAAAGIVGVVTHLLSIFLRDAGSMRLQILQLP